MTVKITVDGRELEVEPGQPLIRACHECGVDVPMYCYHPGLDPVGSCRICQVEVQQGKAPARVVAACRTPVAEGMVVNTETPKVRDTRRECLEFLLKNHPLDCPICDKAGECDLQDYAFAQGQAEGRSNEPRRELKKRVDLGEVIVHDRERCLLCSRCVRFFTEVCKRPQLTVSGLGSRSQISTFGERPLEGNYQGNLADICPVGALTLKRFRFQARVWNLTKTASTCAECSRGCAVTVEVLRRGAVKRLRPRYDAEVNEWWMCDTGRFALEHPNAEGRLIGAALRGYSGLEPATVGDALVRAGDALSANRGAVLALSPFATQEEAGAALALAKSLGAEPTFVSPEPNELGDDFLHTGDPCPNRSGLEQLGFAPLEPAELLQRLQDSSAAVLAGERIAELVGPDELAALSGSLRLVLLDTHLRDVAALDVCISVPTHVEKSGHWLNVDGARRRVGRARTPPAGIEDLDATLARLDALLSREESPA